MKKAVTIFALAACLLTSNSASSMMISQISATAGFDNFNMIIYLNNPSMDKNIAGTLTCPPYVVMPMTIAGIGDSVMVAITNLPPGIVGQPMDITLWNQSGDTTSSGGIMLLHTQTPGHPSPAINWVIPDANHDEFDFQGSIFGKDTSGDFQWRIFNANDSLVWSGPWSPYGQEENAIVTGHVDLTGYPEGTYFLRLFAKNYWYPNGELSEDEVPLQKGVEECSGVEELIIDDAEVTRQYIQLTGQECQKKTDFFIKNRKLYMFRE